MKLQMSFISQDVKMKKESSGNSFTLPFNEEEDPSIKTKDYDESIDVKVCKILFILCWWFMIEQLWNYVFEVSLTLLLHSRHDSLFSSWHKLVLTMNCTLMMMKQMN